MRDTNLMCQARYALTDRSFLTTPFMPTCSWLFHGCQTATAADPIIVAALLDVAVPERVDCAAKGGTRARIARWLLGHDVRSRQNARTESISWLVRMQLMDGWLLGRAVCGYVCVCVCDIYIYILYYIYYI